MATKAKRKSRKRRGQSSGASGPAQAQKQQQKKHKRLEAQAAREQAKRKTGPEEPHPLDVRYGVLRPKPVWHPFPLTSLATIVGIALAVLGFVKGQDSGATYIGAGVLIITVTIGEMCLREHLAGFKSHTLLLAALPVVAVHSLIYFVISDQWAGPPAVFTDLTVAAFLALLLHGKWRTAHVEARKAAKNA